MPYTQPGRGDVHVNRPLTNISVAYMQRMENFISARVFPNISVDKKSDQYFTYDRGEFNRDAMEERGPGAPSAGGDYTISTELITRLASTATIVMSQTRPVQIRTNR